MIAIIGAGIAGLSTALALTKAGHRPRVYERQPQIGDDRGNQALLQIPPHAQAALAQLGVDEPIRAHGFPVERVNLCHADGTHIGTFPAVDGAYYYLHRHELFHTLLASARQWGVDIRYGTTLTGIETGPERTTVVFDELPPVRRTLGYLSGPGAGWSRSGWS
jgi:salicylate hydroxylase